MFKKFLDLIVGHVKTELVRWAEQEFALYVAEKAAPVPESDAPAPPAPADAGD